MTRRGAPASVLALFVLLVLAAPAVAAPSEGYAAWELSGSGGAYSATATDLATGFPTVSLTSTSRAPAALGTGVSAWIPAGTGFGDAFGSGQGRPYVSLRPAADNATTSPSSTTLTFDAPAPVGGWGLALGDVDAETLVVTGTGAAGTVLSGAELGLVETFSYCDASPRSSTCGGQTAPYAVPTPTVGAGAVTLEDTGCPGTPGRCDTVGASAWLSPTVPVTSLTVTSTWKQGAPTYQLWLATAENAVAGSVTATCPDDAPGATVEVLDPDDAVVADTTTGPDGSWDVAGLLAREDWRVRVVPPAAATVEPPGTRDLDLTAGDVEGLDLTLTSVRSVSGTVVDKAGSPVGGAVVRVLSGGAEVGRDTSAGDGTWSVGTVEPADLELAVTAPDGYTAPVAAAVTLGCADATAPALVVAADPTPTPTDSPSATPSATATASPTTPPTTPPNPTGTTPVTPAPPTPTVTSAALASTGAEASPPLALAALLLLSGAGLLWCSRRRPRRAH